MINGVGEHTYLFVLPWSIDQIGGVNQVVINLAREMAKARDFFPIVLINDWNAINPVREVVQGLTTVRWRVRSYRKDMGLKEKLAYFLWEAKFYRDFHKFCIDHKVIAINPHFPGPPIFALERVVKKFETAIPFIVSFHGSDVTAIASAGEDELKQWKMLLADPNHQAVACSNDLGRKLVEALGNEVLPVVAHNGLDVGEFSSAEKKSQPSSDRVVLNVARFEQKKGQDVLIEAFAHIAAEYESVKLVLVGATDKMLPELRALCVRKGIERCVEFYPDVSHEYISDFYKGAAIFCLPSRVEPFGIVILEAASFGVPVVASRIGGIPEILTDGVNGVLVSPDDQCELADAIRSLLDDPITAKEMGKRLTQHVSTHFSWRNAYEKYVDILSLREGR
ncbi:hypothetical protein KEHDKFFH_08420 [Marinobacter maroccanus]|uniref:Glycosyltransferase family 1 protein n=1 Tax=Marinobacter maroccanus TaxID=2055143 RepID=A0A2S5ZBE2_9GAMM|nr:glycosyltransferase family 4 protein [Marinobacter maroccanus]PPI84717.1 hypothetical protein KEHDKFFH_08420 [Marinobacter maroccanus]